MNVRSDCTEDIALIFSERVSEATHEQENTLRFFFFVVFFLKVPLHNIKICRTSFIHADSVVFEEVEKVWLTFGPSALRL